MSNVLIELVKTVAEEIVEEHELDYGNYEFYAQDDKVFVTIEAPNNSVTTATIKLDELDGLNETEIKRAVLHELAHTAGNFDAEDVFEELYSREFIEENGFTTFQFVEMLKEDEEYFMNFYREN